MNDDEDPPRVVPLSKHIGAEIRGLDLREQPTRPPSRRSSGLARSHRHHLPGQKLSQEDLSALLAISRAGHAASARQILPKAYSKSCPASC